MAASHSRIPSQLPLAMVLPSRTERHDIDIIRMPSERVDVSPCVGIPQPDGIITTPTCDGIAIGTERHAIDIIRMPGEGAG